MTNTQAEVAEITVAAGVAKASMPLPKMFLLAILAGVFIALGAAASSVAMHDISNVGVARLVAGCVFPVGLILIVVVGGELFTGNCLMVEALWDGKIKVSGLLRNLAVVYVGNLVGSLLAVALVVISNQLAYSDGGLGAFSIKVAFGKVSLPFVTAFVSGILCNVFVCVAVLGAFAARSVAGKILAIFFPIMAFVLSGFEHCVANMYYIPAGIVAALNPAYAIKAQDLYGYTADMVAGLDAAAFIANIVPVTLGNIVGGIAVGLVAYAAFRRQPPPVLPSP
jgi:formate/nitrite transporter